MILNLGCTVNQGLLKIPKLHPRQIRISKYETQASFYEAPRASPTHSQGQPLA